METRVTIGRNSHWEKQPWLTPEQALAAVEIAREELIEKACKWLLNNLKNYSTNELGAEYLIEDFRKAVEE